MADLRRRHPARLAGRVDGIRDALAIRGADGDWLQPAELARPERVRGIALAPGRAVLVEYDDATSELRTRDFDLVTQDWSPTHVLGTGRSRTFDPAVSSNEAGDLVVTWPQDDRFGFTRTDSLWHRSANSTSWSGPEYVPHGYDLDAVTLADGTFAAMTDTHPAAAGGWLSLHR